MENSNKTGNPALANEKGAINFMVEAVAKFFDGIDLYGVIETLSQATPVWISEVMKNHPVDDKSARNYVNGEIWNITHTMALLTELYHWNMQIEKQPKNNNYKNNA